MWKGWFLALGVAAGPIARYVLSRGPGMRLYGEDRGNWTERLGVVSLGVEGLLLVSVLAAAAARSRMAQRLMTLPARVDQR